MSHLRAVPSEPDDDPVDVDPVAPVDDDVAHTESTEDTEATEADGETDQDVRTYPSTIGGAFYLSILGVAVVAIGIAARSDWRLGIQILGGALVVAALLRLLLAARDAGMLAVRHRFVDVFLLASAGTALVVLATSIPNQPG